MRVFNWMLDCRMKIGFCVLQGYLFLLLSFFVLGQPIRLNDPILKKQELRRVSSDLSDLRIVLERTECFGTCPRYKLIAFGDGRIIYEGFQYVKTQGRIESSITNVQIHDLIAAVSKVRYFTLRNSYVNISDGCESLTSDGPTTYTTVRYKRKSKTIQRYSGCYTGQTRKFDSELKNLEDFENEIDRIVDIHRWIGTEDERKRFKPSILLPETFSQFAFI